MTITKLIRRSEYETFVLSNMEIELHVIPIATAWKICYSLTKKETQQKALTGNNLLHKTHVKKRKMYNIKKKSNTSPNIA